MSEPPQTPLGRAVEQALAAAQSAQDASEARDAELAAERGMTVDAMHEQRAAQDEAERRAETLRRSGIAITAGDIVTIAAGRFATTRTVEVVARWTESTTVRPILILCGSAGIGKTFSAAVAIAAYGNGLSLRAPELAARLAPMPAEREAGLTQIDLAARLLVLDDLGFERDPKASRWADALLRFVDERALYGKTIVTSNLRKAEFSERYDRRVIDRLNASSHAIEFNQSSMREKGAGL